MWLRGLSPEDFRRFIPSSLASYLLFTSYECLRSPSNVLFQSAFGPENLPAAMTALPIVLVGLIALYNWLLSHYGPRGTLRRLTLLSSALLLLCAVGTFRNSPLAICMLFIWGQSYVVILGEQYWSFYNSAFTPETGKKTHGVLAGIMSLGSFTGGMMVSFLSPVIGATWLPVIGALLLIPGLVLIERAYARTPELAKIPEIPKEDAQTSLQLFRTTPLLVFLALVVLATQMLSTTFGLAFQTLLHHSMPQIDVQAAYSGKFYAAVSVLSVFFQFIVTPIALSWTSPQVIQGILPFVHLGTASVLFFHPTVMAATIAFAIFKSLDYSLFRASKEILYMPLSFDARYRAKEWIDVFGYRIGKGLTSGLLWAIQRLYWIGPPIYSGLSIGAVLLWIGLNRRLLNTSSSPKSYTTPNPAIY